MKSGLINMLKPPGMTSHDAVAFARRIFGQKRVGHSGTLDPAATGVLPLYLGTATRLVEYADGFDKTYRAEIFFGAATDTGDDTGTVLRSRNMMPGDLDGLSDAVATFAGGYEQVPPMYSALKFQGKKLYELAREGREIERTPRWIDIRSITLLWVDGQRAGIQVTCSKGTYIRTLCGDIGAKLGLPATMSFLLRMQVGPFLLAAAKTPEEIVDDPVGVLLPAEMAVEHFSAYRLDAAEALLLQQGRPVLCREVSVQPRTKKVRLYSDQCGFFGIGGFTADSGLLQPLKIFRDGIENHADH